MDVPLRHKLNPMKSQGLPGKLNIVNYILQQQGNSNKNNFLKCMVTKHHFLDYMSNINS
jgi:hypothetical protein